MLLAARLLVTRRTVTVPVADGAVSALTGPELLTVAEQVDCLSRAVGRQIGTVPMSLGQAADQMLAAGMDKSVVETIVVGSAWLRAGHSAIRSRFQCHLRAHARSTSRSRRKVGNQPTR